MATRHSPHPQPHVLLVDDEPAVADSLARVLSAMGFRVTTCLCGEEALEVLRREHEDIDVLLTDLRMPRMDGLTLVRQANTIDADLPKVLLSGFGTREEIVEALRLGAHDFLAKPVSDRHRLSTVLMRAADLRRLRRENVRQRLALEQKTAELEATVRELSAANAVIRRHHEQLLQDLVTAARIQRQLLPAHPVPRAGFRFAARFLPSERVSGDFYQVLTIDPAHVLIFMSDVSGHGVSAAMITVFLSQALESAITALGAEGVAQPGLLMGWLNQHFLSLHEEQTMFVTAAAGHLDLVSGWLSLASAGHERPLLRRGLTGRVEPIEADGVGLGLLPDAVFTETLVDLTPGDRLLFYTDGLTETFSPQGEPFGDERLAEVFAAGPEDLEQAADHLLAAVKAHGAGQAQEDDICLLLIGRDRR